jgi:flagellar hook-associated protein 3 FlgL
MRVTSNSYSENLITQLHTLSRRQINLQNQIASGQRVQSASDDPFAAQQVLQLRDNSAANAQYQKNIQTHQEFADATHGLMRNLQKVLDRAQEIATMVDDIDSPQDLQSYATEIDQLIRHAVQIANAQHRGDYLLGGTRTDAEPFSEMTDAAGKVTGVAFGGNTNIAESEIGEGNLVSSRVPGENRSGDGVRGLLADTRAGADFFSHLIALRDQLQSGDVTAIHSTTRDQLKADEENLLFHMADNGALQARLEVSLNTAKDEKLSLEAEISDRTDVDLPETIVRLNQEQTTYQAALQSAGSLLDLGLLPFLR